MHPVLLGVIPVYFLMWGCALLAVLAWGTPRAVQAGFSASRAAAAIGLLAVSIAVGSKLLYLAEAHWFPFDDYVPLTLRGPLHGSRIPGGIVLVAIAMPLVCRLLRLPWRRFGDTIIPAAALALVFIRIGCFLNGCCFGTVSHLPWAVRFPRGGWAYYYQRLHGLIPAGAPAPLPVQPLELYFLATGAAMFGVLLWYQQRTPLPGAVQRVFYALFFGTTALLEPLRANTLTLNVWLCSGALVMALGVAIASASHHQGRNTATDLNPVSSRTFDRPPAMDCGHRAGLEVLNGSLHALPQANLAADTLVPGNIYASWGTFTGSNPGSMVISFNVSTNSGQSWGRTPRQVSDNVAPEDQFLPRVSTTTVTINGSSENVIRVLWYDRRLDSSNLNFDIYETDSTNAGGTWAANARWTTATSTLPQLDPNFDCARPDCVLMDSAAMAALSSGSVIAGWADTRTTESGTPCPGLPSSSPDPEILGGVGC